jgi:hypothetical protein
MLRGRGIRMVRFAVALLLALAPATASGEVFLDFFAGGSWNETTDVSINSSVDLVAAGGGTASAAARLSDVRTSGFVSGGLRAGYYFEFVPVIDIGIGLDAALLPVDVPTQTVNATANAAIQIEVDDDDIISIPAGTTPVPLPAFRIATVTLGIPVLFRLPLLVSESRPQGLLQPYVQVGPAWMLTNADDPLVAGPMVGGGIALAPLSWLVLFAEYRYTAFDGVFEAGDVVIGGVGAGEVVVETELYTHRAFAGIGFRF